MLTRMRLVKGATALLYIGPLIAGLCGFGWEMVASFSAIFVVWLMVLRPEQWPATPGEWLSGSAWLAALAQVLSQILLVTVLFGVGRGLGGLADIGPLTVNPTLPLAVSFLSIPLCRMLWDSREAASMGYFLDEEAEAAYSGSLAGQSVTAIIPLLNLPDGAPDVQVTAAVAAALDVPTADLRLNAATAALAHPDRRHAALRRALILWATEPQIVAPGQLSSSMDSTFSIAKPVLEIDLSPPAKNLVLSSIFVATDQFLARHEASAAAPPSPASGSPAPVRNLFGQATGSLVNTSA